MSCEISISLASLRKTNVVVWSLLVSFDCVGGERLLQFRVLGFGLLQDWDVRVGVFPEREKIVVGSLRFCSLTCHEVSTTELEICKSANWFVQNNASMIENLLKFLRCPIPVACS